MSTELVTHDDPAAAVTLFGTDNPAEVLERATIVARSLTDVVRQQGLHVRIGQSEYLRVEAWTFLGSQLGVFPIVRWSKPVMDGDVQIGWEARVEACTRTGEVVGAAEAMCLRTERSWQSRDDYALRSMAQTRATSKALRLPLGFVVVLAGFNPTPAEEMPVVEHRSVGEPSADALPPVEDADTSSGSVAQAGEDEPASPAEHIHAAARKARGDQPPVDLTDPDIPFGDAPPVRYISQAQRTRLFTIAGKCGLEENEIRAIVREFTGQESTQQIPPGQVYDGIISAIQAKGSA